MAVELELFARKFRLPYSHKGRRDQGSKRLELRGAWYLPWLRRTWRAPDTRKVGQHFLLLLLESVVISLRVR